MPSLGERSLVEEGRALSGERRRAKEPGRHERELVRAPLSMVLQKKRRRGVRRSSDFRCLADVLAAHIFSLPWSLVDHSMASPEVVEEEKDRRKTPPKSPLAADAKPFVPSSSPLKAAAADEGKEKEQQEEEEEEEEAKESGGDEESEGDDDNNNEEQQPAPVKTFPVFSDQQRSRPSMQVRRGRRGKSQETRGKGAVSGALGWVDESSKVGKAREALFFTHRFRPLRFPSPEKNPNTYTYNKPPRRAASSSSAASRTGRRPTRCGSTRPSSARSRTSR